MKALTENSHINMVFVGRVSSVRAPYPRYLSNPQAEIENVVVYEKNL